MDLLKRFTDYIKSNQLFSSKDQLLLAVSGGLDSVALIELCQQAGYNFIMAHCNFQLREEESNRDEQFVKELAAAYKKELFVKSFDTKTIAQQQKTSIEETARQLRYTWFQEIIEQRTLNQKQEATTGNKQLPVWYIVTAHHADDTIETVLMNFFRGTGIKGLRGIQPKQGKIIRPLLFARKKELETFVKAHQLKYVTDSTNFENEYTRNFFRNQLLPSIKEYYHAADENILKNAERFMEVEELYNQAIDLHKKKLLEHKGAEVHIPVLKLKKSTPLATLVYEIIKDFNFTSHQTCEVIALLDSETGKYIASATHRIIKNRNWLIIAPLKWQEDGLFILEGPGRWLCGNTLYEVEWQNQVPLHIPDSPATVHLDASLIKFPLLLRKWKPGDYFYPLGMKKKKKLARFFIDHKLSLTEKENIWVVESDKRIVWVVGYRLDDRFKLTPHTRDVLSITSTRNE
jgi:tRNA(Ile)-lysidine synthase